MKVLQVLSSLNSAGGVSTVVMNFYRNINREKIQFDFLIFYKMPQNFHKEVESYGGKIYFFPELKPQNFLKLKKEFKKFIIEHKDEYDIIHSHELLIDNMLFPYVKKYTNAIRIMHLHSSKFSSTKLGELRNYLISFHAYKKADYIFACSKKAAVGICGEKILKSPKYIWIRNAINTSNLKYSELDRKKVRKEFKIDNKKVILHLGRLSLEKNHKFIFNIVNKIEDSDVCLLVVGAGSLEKELKDYVSTLSCKDNIIFTGARTDVSAMMSAADILVLPSLFEGFPVVTIESQTNGLKTIISNKISDEVLITPNIKMLPLDENMWIKEIETDFQDNSRKFYDVSEFEIKNEANRLEEIYRKILKI